MGIDNEGPKVPPSKAVLNSVRKRPASTLGMQFVGDTLPNSKSPTAESGVQPIETPSDASKKAQAALANNRLGIGQVNTEQPTTGGKIEPDERDGVRH